MNNNASKRRLDGEVRLVSMREAFLKAFDVKTAREVRMIFGRRRFDSGSTERHLQDKGHNEVHERTSGTNADRRRMHMQGVQRRRVA